MTKLIDAKDALWERVRESRELFDVLMEDMNGTIRSLKTEIEDAFAAAELRGANTKGMHGKRKDLVELVSDAMHSLLNAKAANADYEYVLRRVTEERDDLKAQLLKSVEAVEQA